MTAFFIPGNVGDARASESAYGEIRRQTELAMGRRRTELLDPIHVDQDPERVNDRDYVTSIHHEVQSAIQRAMDRLAKQRRFPIFG